MKKVLLVCLVLLVLTACVKNKRAINPNEPDPNTDEKVKTNYGMVGEFRGEIESSVRNNIEIYSVTDERSKKNYLVFSNGDGVFVIEDKKAEIDNREDYYENR